MSRSRYKIFKDRHPYFMTCTVVAWLPIFCRPKAVEIILESWRSLQSNERLELFTYVIMENHLHLIASSDNLAKTMKDFESYTARRIIDHLEATNAATLLSELRFFKARHKTESKYQLWQEGSHPQEIQNDEMMIQKIEYTRENPLPREYVDDATHWRYSSARNYAGMAGLIEVNTQWR